MAVTKSFDMVIAGELNLDLILYGAGFLHECLRAKGAVTCARAGNITGALSTQAPRGIESFHDVELRNRFLSEHKFSELLAH